MPILSTIERRGLKGRTLVLAIYSLLIIGAVSMVYPFLLMLAGSTKSAVDTTEAKVFPDYLTSTPALWTKFSEALYNESLEQMRQATGVDVPSFGDLAPPERTRERFVDEWLAFLEQVDLPEYTYTLGHLHTPQSKTTPLLLRKFKSKLRDQYGTEIAAINEALSAEFAGWFAFNIRPDIFELRRNRMVHTPLASAFREFKNAQPVRYRFYTSVEGFFVRNYLRSQFGREIGSYNKAHGTNFASYDQVHLTRRVPPAEQTQHREDWLTFVRVILNPFWIGIGESATSDYRAYLKAKYAGDIAALNRLYETKHTNFDQLNLPGDLRAIPGAVSSDLDTFLQGWTDPETHAQHIAPADALFIRSTEFAFRDWLIAKHGNLESLNAALETNFRTTLNILPPQEEQHYQSFLEQERFWRKEFTTRNFVAVTDYIVLRGRGLLNTAIYCSLAVLAALIVNPLAAYALSRYKPPSAYKILLFMMLTMAFPPMVTQIPVFLMLRELSLLNTFAALVLPGLANGYSIFLLKGFFDSLPKELYESAALDGAGEFRIFWQITMSLSKPILAVIGLSAFTLAYSDFMMALLICQDQSMWTLMVWMYQLQQQSGQGVIFASLLIAAIPTFIIFVFCQNIIMRGIVVPVEK